MLKKCKLIYEKVPELKDKKWKEFRIEEITEKINIAKSKNYGDLKKVIRFLLADKKIIMVFKDMQIVNVVKRKIV